MAVRRARLLLGHAGRGHSRARWRHSSRGSRSPASSAGRSSSRGCGCSTASVCAVRAARGQLTVALSTFERLRAQSWATRAGTELRATAVRSALRARRPLGAGAWWMREGFPYSVRLAEASAEGVSAAVGAFTQRAGGQHGHGPGENRDSSGAQARVRSRTRATPSLFAPRARCCYRAAADGEPSRPSTSATAGVNPMDAKRSRASLSGTFDSRLPNAARERP